MDEKSLSPLFQVHPQFVLVLIWSYALLFLDTNDVFKIEIYMFKRDIRESFFSLMFSRNRHNILKFLRKEKRDFRRAVLSGDRSYCMQ